MQVNKGKKTETVSEYKVGAEVKALFKKNHIDLLDPSPEAEALEEKRVLFINKVLEKVISEEPSPKDREDIGSLISAVEWQCFDENHNRDSAHVLHNIIEFRVNIYAAQKMHPGGSWFLCHKKYRTQGLSSTLRTRWQILPLCCLPWFTPLSEAFTSSAALQIRKGVRDQKVVVNCSLFMPIGSM